MLVSKNIYLSDDDIDDVEFFQDALGELCTECKITVSHNGEDLLTQLVSTKSLPDVIFLDVNMPKVTGLEALKLIKTTASLHKIPVVICSTSSNEIYINDARTLGASFYMVKPSSLSVLKQNIYNILSFNWKNHIPAEVSSGFVMNR